MNSVQLYLNTIVDDLRTASERALIAGGNNADRGENREDTLLSFLNQHLPRRLTSATGGKVVGITGTESKQIDIFATNDIGVRFEKERKTFVTAEGLASAISVKTTLNTDTFKEALENLKSIPEPSAEGLEFPSLRQPSNAFNSFLDYHPSKFIFAYNGVSPEIIRDSFQEELEKDKDSRGLRRTTVIVNGQYVIDFHRNAKKTSTGDLITPNSLHISKLDKDIRGYSLAAMLNSISAYTDWLNAMRINIHPYFGEYSKDKS